MDNSWTDENTEILKRLRSEGFSASKIGEIIGKTRSAVLGKCSRLGLKRASIGKSVTNAQQPKRSRHPKSRNSLKDQNIAEPISKMLDILDLTYRTCKWPVNETSPYKFCGHDKQRDVPYCSFHLTASIR